MSTTTTLVNGNLSPIREFNSETEFRPNDPWNNPKSFESTVTKEIRFCLYVRKSSEDDERQALSIDSQIESMRKVSERDGLNVVEIIRESKSAKASWARDGFNELLNGIAQGRYNSILAWAPDRLSRNAGDLGALVDLMDKWGLIEIRTNGQVFKNAPNEKFLLMILCSQAKLENDNRSINVTRWLRFKAQTGHMPHMVPLGYLNQRSYMRNGGRNILDPDRAPYIKQIFERSAHEGMSWRAIQRWLLEETPLRTRNGKPVVVSAIYKILNNPFYYWMFEYPKGSKNWCKGEYEPINHQRALRWGAITSESFSEIQTESEALRIHQNHEVRKLWVRNYRTGKVQEDCRTERPEKLCILPLLEIQGPSLSGTYGTRGCSHLATPRNHRYGGYWYDSRIRRSQRGN